MNSSTQSTSTDLPLPADWSRFRAEFPACSSLHYFDIARKSVLPAHVRRTLNDWLDDIDRTGGSRAFSFDEVERARRTIAETYGAASEALSFMKNTSEGINLVAQGYTRLRPGDNVLVSAEEHENNALPWRRLELRGIEVRFVHADEAGRLHVDAFREAADSRTRVIAVSWVTYGRGVRVDIPLLGQFAAEKELLLVVDAIQGLGILSDRIDSLGAHVVASGAHKAMFGLNGSGILYTDPAVIDQIDPLYAAKNSFTSNDRFQARPELLRNGRRFEYGNPNFAGIAVMRASAEFLAGIGAAAIEHRIEELTGFFIACADSHGLRLRTPREWRHRAAILSFETPGSASEIVADLRGRGFIMSEKDGHVRASVHAFNHEDEIAEAVAAMARAGLGTR